MIHEHPIDKPLLDRTEPELKALMVRCVDAVKARLPAGTMFCLLVFDQPRVTQYIANVERAGAIAAMREAADRMESSQTTEDVDA